MPTIDINIESLSFKMEVFDSETLSNQLKERGYHGQNDVGILRDLLCEGSSFMDLGANIGWYSLLGSYLVGPQGIVYAYEPDTTNISLLKKSIDYNQITNIQLHKFAVSDYDGFVDFYKNPENYGDHSISPTTYQRCFNVDTRYSLPDVIPCRKIDSVISPEEFKKVQLIKIDIQGSECKALAGMINMLGVHRPHILLEYSPAHIYAVNSSPFELFVFLEKNRYVPLLVTPAGNAPVKLEGMDMHKLFEYTSTNHNTFVGVDLLLVPA